MQTASAPTAAHLARALLAHEALLFELVGDVPCRTSEPEDFAAHMEVMRGLLAHADRLRLQLEALVEVGYTGDPGRLDADPEALNVIIAAVPDAAAAFEAWAAATGPDRTKWRRTLLARLSALDLGGARLLASATPAPAAAA